MLTDSDSALKRKRDDSGIIYVSNAENLDISHATVMSATLPARKIIGIDAYHMDTQGRKPGNCRGLTPLQTRKDLRRLVVQPTLPRNGVKTSLQTTSTFPPTCRKKATPPNDTTMPPATIGALMEHQLQKPWTLEIHLPSNIYDPKTSSRETNRSISMTTPYAKEYDISDTFTTPMNTYGKGSSSMDEAIPALSAVPENPSPYITTQTNPGLVAMMTSTRFTLWRKKDLNTSRSVKEDSGTLAVMTATSCTRRPAGTTASTLTVQLISIKKRKSYPFKNQATT